jgi:hypothetical protein
MTLSLYSSAGRLTSEQWAVTQEGRKRLSFLFFFYFYFYFLFLFFIDRKRLWKKRKKKRKRKEESVSLVIGLLRVTTKWKSLRVVFFDQQIDRLQPKSPSPSINKLIGLDSWSKSISTILSTKSALVSSS